MATCGTLEVPNAWLPKLKLDGLVLTAPMPVPVKLTVGLTVALSLMVSVSLRAPATAGVKKTEMLQLLPAASVPVPTGQVVVVE